MSYLEACKEAATEQGLDPLTAAVASRRAEIERAGVNYDVEQTGGFTMVASFYLPQGRVVTCTNEGGWIVVNQPTSIWLDGGYSGDFEKDGIEDLSPAVTDPDSIIDAVLEGAGR